MLLCENADYLNHQINFHDLLKKMDLTWKMRMKIFRKRNELKLAIMVICIKLTIYFQKGQIGSYGNDYDDGGAFEKGLSQKMDHGGQKMI